MKTSCKIIRKEKRLDRGNNKLRRSMRQSLYVLLKTFIIKKLCSKFKDNKEAIKLFLKLKIISGIKENKLVSIS